MNINHHTHHVDHDDFGLKCDDGGPVSRRDYLKRGDHDFFDGPAFLIRDFSHQSHHRLIECAHGQVCNAKLFNVVRPSIGGLFS